MEKFFDEFLNQLPTASPAKISELMARAEIIFRQAGYRDEINDDAKNILVLRTDRIGDMILTSGFLRELRKNFPRARITLLVSPTVFPIVELCPYVNEILTVDKFSLDEKEFPAMLEPIVEFCRKNFWRKRFSHAFLPQWDSSNFADLLIAWLSGARERIGYGLNPAMDLLGSLDAVAESRDTFLLTKNIISPCEVVSEAEKHFYVLQASGLDVKETHMELFFGEEDFIRARELLQNVPPNCRKVLLGIGGSGAGRQYPVEKYLLAFKELAKKNLVVVLVGGQTEINDADFLEKNLPHGKVLNLVGKTTLRETEAVVVQTDFYVGNDTGVMHMAAASKIPCLVLYREAQDKEDYLPGVFSEFRRFPPWQTNSIILRPDRQLDECAKLPPVYGWCHYSEPHCITQITPQEIIDGFEVLETLG